ncbi:MAG: hypothetical protein F6J95_021740 [Leptolyngbya sp. SIO1E4]|nr:hypothetical protein [Leptolyngbya sp. SIO1E4]
MQFRTVPLLVMLVGLVLPGGVAIAQSSSESSEVPTTVESPEDLATLRELAEHFAGVGVPGDELIVGELPEGLVLENLPMPDDARLLGSIARGGNYFDILLQSNQSPQAIDAFYQEQLLSAGWQLVSFPGNIWNFAKADIMAQLEEQHSTDSFCSDTEGVYLHTTATAFQPNQATTVNLSVQQVEAEGMPLDCSANAFDNLPPLPTLHLPDTVRPTAGTTTPTTGDLLATYVVIESDMTGEALLAHFAEQYEQAGWAPVERSDDEGPFSASWTIENDQGQTWQSTFNVLRLHGTTDEYLLSAQAEPKGN